MIRPITDALNLIPTLCNEARDLRRGLALALADLADLAAAVKATLGAYADGESDPSTTFATSSKHKAASSATPSERAHGSGYE